MMLHLKNLAKEEQMRPKEGKKFAKHRKALKIK